MDNQRLDAETALRIIKSRKLIKSPGKYTAQVINEANPYEDKMIMNVKATTQALVETAKQLYRDGEYDNAANTNLSYSTFADTGYVAAQGEHVSIMVDYVTNREGKEVLAIVALTEIQTKATKNVDLGDEFDNLLDTITNQTTGSEEEEITLDN